MGVRLAHPHLIQPPNLSLMHAILEGLLTVDVLVLHHYSIPLRQNVCSRPPGPKIVHDLSPLEKEMKKIHRVTYF